MPIYGQFSDPVPEDFLSPICEATFGTERTDTILSSSNYPASPSGVDGSVDARVQLQFIGTDYIWRCSSWTFARNWVQNGGSAYVGVYQIGASYPGNDAVQYCGEPGVICHQDDIQVVVSSGLHSESFLEFETLFLTLSNTSSVRFKIQLPRRRHWSPRCRRGTRLSWPMEILTLRASPHGRRRQVPMCTLFS